MHRRPPRRHGRHHHGHSHRPPPRYYGRRYHHHRHRGCLGCLLPVLMFIAVITAVISLIILL